MGVRLSGEHNAFVALNLARTAHLPSSLPWTAVRIDTDNDCIRPTDRSSSDICQKRAETADGAAVAAHWRECSARELHLEVGGQPREEMEDELGVRIIFGDVKDLHV